MKLKKSRKILGNGNIKEKIKIIEKLLEPGKRSEKVT